jgi:hypothetical protein
MKVGDLEHAVTGVFRPSPDGTHDLSGEFVVDSRAPIKIGRMYKLSVKDGPTYQVSIRNIERYTTTQRRVTFGLREPSGQVSV